jgi:hypothetical protein
MAMNMADLKQDPLRVSSEHIDDASLPKGEEAMVKTESNGLGMSDEEFDVVEKSLVRKLDFTLVPMVWLLYLFNYLDRNNIA